MVYERTSYTPKPGQLDAVLAVRRQANAVRRQMGLPSGEIFVEQRADGGSQTVQWQCRFIDAEAQARDLAARNASDVFAAVRTKMGALIDDFSRKLLHRADESGSVLVETPLDGVPIVPREITFVSGNLELTGYLYAPPGEGPFPCMITNHGSSIHQGTSDVCRPGVAAVLMSWGVASFLPHRRGYGNSPGVPWREDVSAAFGTTDYDDQLAKRLYAESEDVIAALGTVEQLGEVDADHIGVMGSSFGGTVTLLAAAQCPRFRCAVEFAGAAMNWERTPALRATMHEAAARLTQPIFFMQAANDYSTRPTVELAEGLAGTGKQVEHRVYPGFGLTRDEGHFLYGQGNMVWSADVRRFLDRHL